MSDETSQVADRKQTCDPEWSLLMTGKLCRYRLSATTAGNRPRDRSMAA